MAWRVRPAAQRWGRPRVSWISASGRCPGSGRWSRSGPPAGRGPSLGWPPMPVGRAVDLPAADAAAGQGDREDGAPVVAAAAGLNRGVRPNSRHAHHQRLVEQAALARSSSSAEKAWSVGGTRTVLSRRGSRRVRVPARVVRRLVRAAVPVHLHQPHARLDQPPGQQAALAEVVPAVAVADRSRLRAPGRTPPRPAASASRSNACAAASSRPRRRVAVDAVEPASSRSQQVAAVVEPVGGTSAGRVNSGMRNPAAAGSQRNSHGSAARPRKPASWPGQTRAVGVEDLHRQPDRGRQPAAVAAEPADQRAEAAASRWAAPGLAFSTFIGCVRHAGQHVVAAGRVGVVAGRDGPQQAQLVGLRGPVAAAARRCGRRGRWWRSGRTRRGPRRGASGLGSQVECCGGPAHQEQDDARLRPAQRRHSLNSPHRRRRGWTREPGGYPGPSQAHPDPTGGGLPDDSGRSAWRTMGSKGGGHRSLLISSDKTLWHEVCAMVR